MMIEHMMDRGVDEEKIELIRQGIDFGYMASGFDCVESSCKRFCGNAEKTSIDSKDGRYLDM